MGEALCHLCQRPFGTETMFRDRDGDFWCYSDDCHAVAFDRMRNPKSPYRRRREIARLEYLYAPPIDPMTLFAIPTAAEIFGLASAMKFHNVDAQPHVDGAVRPNPVSGEQHEQLRLLDEKAA